MADKPNIIKRLQLAAQVFRRGMPVKAAPYFWPTMTNGQVQWTLNDFVSYCTEGFSLNAVIYTAEKYKFQAISQVVWRAYKGDPDQPEPVPTDDPLARLLARPNAFQSQSEWMALNMVYLDMAGNSYNFLDWKPGEPLPSAIYPLRPDRLHIVAKGSDLLGYVYIPEGKTSRDGAVPILPQYMMHVKYPNPLDPYEGMGEGLSPMAPLAQSGDVDNSLTTFLKNIFDRGTMPFGAIETPNALDNDTAARLRDEWDEMYGGVEQSGRPLILDNGMKYTALSAPLKDLVTEKIDGRNEVRIHGPLGVPVILTEMMSGIAGSTYSNKEEARRMFWEDTMAYVIGLFTADLAYHLGVDGYIIKADTSAIPALRRNMNADSETLGRLVSSGVPINSAIKALNLPIEPVEGGDIPLVSTSLVPLDKLLNPPAPPPQLAPFTGRPARSTAPADDAIEDDNEGAANARDDEDQRAELEGLILELARKRQRLELVKKKPANGRMTSTAR